MVRLYRKSRINEDINSNISEIERLSSQILDVINQAEKIVEDYKDWESLRYVDECEYNYDAFGFYSWYVDWIESTLDSEYGAELERETVRDTYSVGISSAYFSTSMLNDYDDLYSYFMFDSGSFNDVYLVTESNGYTLSDLASNAYDVIKALVDYQHGSDSDVRYLAQEVRDELSLFMQTTGKELVNAANNYVNAMKFLSQNLEYSTVDESARDYANYDED